jgi:hypothetical protein
VTAETRSTSGNYPLNLTPRDREHVLDHARLERLAGLSHEALRKKAQTGKCGGRKTMLERNPLIVQVAKRLSEEKHRSLREIAAELEAVACPFQLGNQRGLLKLRHHAQHLPDEHSRGRVLEEMIRRLNFDVAVQNIPMSLGHST